MEGEGEEVEVVVEVVVLFHLSPVHPVFPFLRLFLVQFLFLSHPRFLFLLRQAAACRQSSPCGCCSKGRWTHPLRIPRRRASRKFRRDRLPHR